MTKSQAFYYFAIVILITLLAYLYTTVVQAPTLEPEPETERILVAE
jgi:hypothetical protein